MHALRPLLKRPLFAGSVVVTIGLTFGLAATVLSFLHEVLIRPVTSSPDGERLAVVYASIPAQRFDTFDANIPELLDLGQRSRALETVTPYASFQSLTLMGDSSAQRLETTFCEAAYFTLQGARAHLGRLFQPEETAANADAAVVVLTYRTWQQNFGANPGIIGTELRLSGRAFTVIGVLPKGFRSAGELRQRVDIFVPLPLGRMVYGNDFLTSRTSRVFHAVAQLKPGVVLAQAQADAERVANELATAYPNEQAGYSFRLRGMRTHFYAEVLPLAAALGGGVAFVLLIACANLAHLFLVQVEARRREFAVRAAIGAGRGELTRLCLAEATALSSVGGGLGLGLAAFLVEIFNREGALRLPTFSAFSLSLPVVLGTMLLLALFVLATALLPALAAGRVPPAAALAGGHSAGVTRRSALRRHSLVATQVAFAVLLLTGTGLTVRTLLRVQGTDPGFNPSSLLTGAIELNPTRFTNRPARAQASRDLHRLLQDIPGAGTAMLWGPRVIGAASFNIRTTPQGLDPAVPANQYMTRRLQTSPEGLAALGIPLVAGRTFNPDATPTTPIEVIVGENYARRFWPGQNAVGKAVSIPFAPNPIVAQVIGVARDARHLGRAFDESQIIGDVYFNQFQLPTSIMSVAIRYRGQPDTVLAELRRRLAQFDPGMALSDISTTEARLAQREGTQHLAATLFTVFGALAALLTGVGVYGVLAFQVGQRTREYGVRLSLGAQPRQIIAGLFRQIGPWIATGITVGLVASWQFGEVVRGLLVGASPRDPLVFTSVALGVALLGLVASLLPAIRASRVNPLIALRAE